MFSVVPVGWFSRTEEEDCGLVHPPEGAVLGGKKQERLFYRSLTLREENVNEN